MAANKYLSQVAGVVTEVSGSVTSTANALVALDAAGLLDASVMPVGIGADTASIITSENLTAGDLVNIYDVTGTPTARKADNSNGREATGFVLAGSTSPAAALVYFEGKITGLSAMTAGTKMYLGVTGAATETSPSTTGYISQRIGTAISATVLSFEPNPSITLA